jgi:hypothetical protein
MPVFLSQGMNGFVEHALAKKNSSLREIVLNELIAIFDSLIADR